MTDTGEKAWEDWSIFVNAVRPPRRTDNLTLSFTGAPDEIRQFLYQNQQGKCAGCRYDAALHMLTIGHKKPRSRGGSDDINNPQLMCHTCNAIKGSRDMGYLRQRLSELGIA